MDSLMGREFLPTAMAEGLKDNGEMEFYGNEVIIYENDVIIMDNKYT